MFTGDDNDNLDDEDGLVFNHPMNARSTATLTVTVTDDSGAGGFVDIWIDFDESRDWETGEHIFGGVSQPVVAGENVLEYFIPESAAFATAFTRVRLSRAGGLPTTGAAPDGEVEDHQGPSFGNADTVVTGRLYVDVNGNGSYDEVIDEPVPGVVWLDRDGDGRLTGEDRVAVADRETGIYELAGRERVLSKELTVLVDSLGRPVLVPVLDFSELPVVDQPRQSVVGGRGPIGLEEEPEDEGDPVPFGELTGFGEALLLVFGLQEIETESSGKGKRTPVTQPMSDEMPEEEPEETGKGIFASWRDQAGQNFISVVDVNLNGENSVLIPLDGFTTSFVLIGISGVDSNGMVTAVGQLTPGPPTFNPLPAIVEIDLLNNTATGTTGSLNPPGKPSGLTIENYQAINSNADRILAQAVDGSFMASLLVIDRNSGAVIHTIPASASPPFLLGPYFLVPGSGGNLLVFFSGNRIRELTSAGAFVADTTFDDVFGAGSNVFFSGVDADQNFIGTSNYGNVASAELNGPPFPDHLVINGRRICGDYFQARLEVNLGVTSGQPFQILNSFSGPCYTGASAPKTITANPNGTLLDGQDFIITAVAAVAPTVSIRRNPDGTVTVEFTGVLERNATLGGPFTPMPEVTSPYNFVPVGREFFRSR